MKWLKSWLQQQPNGEFNFEESLVFDSNLIKSTRYLLGLREIVILGQGFYMKETETLTLNFSIQGIMIVPCALSLEPVDYPFTTSTEIKYTFINSTKNDEIIVVKGLEIDIIPFVWELISLEIPLKVIKPGASISTKGDNWEVINEATASQKPIDPRLAKLNEFFKKQ